MRKALITLLTLSGIAMADTTTVTDVTKNFEAADVTYTAPTTADGTGSFTGSGIWAVGGGNVAHSALTFVLDLTELQKLTAQTKIVNFDESYDLGLFWAKNGETWGLGGNWAGALWLNNGGCFASIDTLKSNAFTVKDSQDQFITLTVTVANPVGAQGGEQLYVAGSDTSLFTNSSKLGSSSNTSISSIDFSTNVIKAAAVTSGWVPGTTASTLGTALKTTFIEAHSVPEPATATLSLLALAGLASRRRRH